MKMKPKSNAPMENSIPKKIKSPDHVRLNKFLSNAGICSRREADENIKMGLV